MCSQGLTDETTIPANGVDHLVFASANLQQGMDDIESLLGVRPVPGGHHPQYGTHNALLSLGAGTYIEIIARDPQLPLPERGALVDLPPGTNSRLVTWVYRSANIRDSVIAAASARIGLGALESGSRTTPNGDTISWQLTDPYALPLSGAIPFLINWGETPHPSKAVPSGGRLVELVIEHPEPDLVRESLAVLGADIEVKHGNEYRLTATIETTGGLVTLQ